MIVADCTGHGVPGAFMTLIGNSILDKIVKGKGITDPAQILDLMHTEVYQALKQKYNGNNYGMDAIAINIHTPIENTRKVIFSGAKNSMYYIDAQKNKEVIEVKGSRKAIGGFQNNKISFENRDISLSKDSIIYLGSDGYMDQNNVKRKKLGSNGFIRLILECSHMPLDEQKVVFETALKEHMEGTIQRDDILLMGIKV